MTVQTKQYTPFVQVGSGVKLYVEDSCSGTLGTFVFIHGWPMSSKVYEYQFQHLAPRGYRCVGIDMRGFGNSDKPWSEYNYDVFADDIKIVLDTLDLKDVVLVGHSMGGAIALHYAATKNSGRLKKLALISPAAPSFIKRDDFVEGIDRAVIDSMINDCLADRVKLLAKFGEACFAKPLSPTFYRYFHSLALAASPYATVKCLEALRDSDLRKDMGQVKIATAIMHGVKDAVTPFALAEVLHHGIKNSQLIPFENSGHAIFYEELAEFNQRLIDFAT
jgi:non-heme chloroperoxidase